MKGLSASFVVVARRLRVQRLVDQWSSSNQGLRVKAELGELIANACRWEVETIAKARASDEKGEVILTRSQVAVCESRVVSQARVAAHGPWALNTHDKGARWRKECEQVRASIVKGNFPPRLGELVMADPKEPSQ